MSNYQITYLSGQNTQLVTGDDDAAGLLNRKLASWLNRLSYSSAKAYLHWLNLWSRWLNEYQQYHHLAFTPPLPVEPQVFTAFVAEQSLRLRASSLRQMLASLDSVAKALHMPSVVNEEVDSLLESCERNEALQELVTGQAIPFTLEDLRALIALHRHSASVRNLRDLIIIWLGFETLLRSAELRRIRLSNLKWHTAEQCYYLAVYRTKTRLRTNISYKLSSQLSNSINHLLSRTGLDVSINGDRYLFQAVNYHDTGYMPAGWLKRPAGKSKVELLERSDLPLPHRLSGHAGKALSPREDTGVISSNTVLRAFESLWLSLGNTPKNNGSGQRYQCWTGHSVRVGGARELALNGYSLPQIMEMGNWSSSAIVLRYIGNLVSGQKAMVSFVSRGLADIQD